MIFVNGFAFACLELKSNFSGQNIQHVQNQYKKDCDHITRFFNSKIGAIVFFSIDLYEYVMTTELKKSKLNFCYLIKAKVL